MLWGNGEEAAGVTYNTGSKQLLFSTCTARVSRHISQERNYGVVAREEAQGKRVSCQQRYSKEVLRVNPLFEG
jgi:hypothetical protein